MASAKSGDKRIILMGPELMKLYDVAVIDVSIDYHPLTFCNPRDCLDMMIEPDLDDVEEDPEEVDSPEAKAERLERQWGELELRLSFLVEACNWQ